MSTEPEHTWFDDYLNEAAGRPFDEAVKLWQQAVIEHPGSALPHLMLGSEYAEAGALREAEDAYSRALLIDGELHIARFLLGLLQFCDLRAPLALLTWAPLNALPDTAPLRLFAEGFAALAQEQTQSALDRFQKGLTLLTNNPALTRDIQRVVERIQAASDEGEHSPADYHFLLANYREAGKLH